MMPDEYIDYVVLHARRRGEPCPTGGCEHNASRHCHHRDGRVHCTGGCPCGPRTELCGNRAERIDGWDPRSGTHLLER